jgi:nucleoside-diphosphate-sugar epimerase
MTTSIPPIGVTGSTGQLGGRVATRLATLGQPQRLLVRDLARASRLPGAEAVQASYEDRPSMRAALSGIQTLFLVSGYGHTRVEQHYSAIDAAIAAGVERIVYTSFLAATPSRRSLVMLPRPWLTTSTSIRRAINTSLRPGFDPIQDEVDQQSPLRRNLIQSLLARCYAKLGDDGCHE